MNRNSKVLLLFFLIQWWIPMGFGQVQPRLDMHHLPKKEKLSYDVFYHWGMIFKKAGMGDFALSHASYKGKECFQVTLFGKTSPFVDAFFKVRDTLKAYCTLDGFLPQYYTKRVHEGDYHSVDENYYTYFKHATRIDVKTVKGDTLELRKGISTPLPVYDMLSVFYYLRSIDFKNCKKGDEFPVGVVSGRSLFLLKFVFLEKKQIKIRKIGERVGYQVRLVFWDSNGNVDDDSMVATIGDDPFHTPLQLVAKLRMGYMKAILHP